MVNINWHVPAIFETTEKLHLKIVPATKYRSEWLYLQPGPDDRMLLRPRISLDDIRYTDLPQVLNGVSLRRLSLESLEAFWNLRGVGMLPAGMQLYALVSEGRAYYVVAKGGAFDYATPLTRDYL